MGTYPTTNCAKKSIIGKVAAVLRDELATATNIEFAVDKAGVDRDEVTAVFGSVQALVLEMLSELSGALTRPLEDHTTDRTVRDVLIELGNRLANTYSVSHLIALYRIVAERSHATFWDRTRTSVVDIFLPGEACPRVAEVGLPSKSFE